jgi:hypothetical protein
MQHFSSAAVSTGLTVAARMDNRLWQGYYVVFIALALYHGINGLIGILNDYCPPRPARNAANLLLWLGGAFLLAVAVLNIAGAQRLDAAKLWYAQHGLPAGESRGNPPGLAYTYDFQDELRELHLFGHYLEHHCAGAPEELASVFGPSTAEDRADLARAGGVSFERWAREQIATGQPKEAQRQRGMIFSSPYEFAVWALNVRRVNAEQRGDTATAQALATIPAYSPSLH